MIAYLRKDGSTSATYFHDSHSALGYTGLLFQWLSDTELKASYTVKDHAEVEQWTVSPDRFEMHGHDRVR